MNACDRIMTALPTRAKVGVIALAAQGRLHGLHGSTRVVLLARGC
jgi:hypothetical protein